MNLDKQQKERVRDFAESNALSFKDAIRILINSGLQYISENRQGDE